MTSDEYRRNARECQRMADNAHNPTDKASWLRLAASWLGMIKNAPGQASDNDTQRPAAQEAKQAAPDTAKQASWPKPSDEDSQASH